MSTSGRSKPGNASAELLHAEDQRLTDLLRKYAAGDWRSCLHHSDPAAHPDTPHSCGSSLKSPKSCTGILPSPERNAPPLQFSLKSDPRKQASLSRIIGRVSRRDQRGIGISSVSGVIAHPLAGEVLPPRTHSPPGPPGRMPNGSAPATIYAATSRFADLPQAEAPSGQSPYCAC